ncbi:PaaI family thioesterase [Acuticoccus sediminis]|uniref:PaaI family thioesterase n=1 Tax=Acuticoccus sediminis TaxID=2184697 RepID=A0A8B2NVB5_9HYPH|nr:PaaI family thioesterase [Acuticoccus sediminis]RAI02439.1 PaaI family thioesterase [Acuticoccus sediminis]
MDRPVPPEGWKAMEFPGLIGRLGPLLSQRNGDGWRYGLVVEPMHTNVLGIVHGGTLMTLLDQTATLEAVWRTRERSIVTISMTTRFLGAGRLGDLLVGEGRLTKVTRSLIFLEAAISAGGEPVADASVIMKRTGTGGKE